MKEIKRVSFRILEKEGTDMDPYISDEIEDIMDTYRIKEKNIINITENKIGETYHISIYYRKKFKAK